MSDLPDFDPIHDKALLASFGLLDSEEEKELHRLAEQGDPQALAEMTIYREVLAQVAQTIPFATPSATLKDRLMASVKAQNTKLRPGWQTHEPGFDYVLSGQGLWQDAPFPGVKFQVLHYDKKADLLTQLVRLAPGAKFPPHRHGAAEQCLVLEGIVSIGTLNLRPGDFNLAAANTVHNEMTTEEGCLLLLVSNPHDEVVALA